LKSAALSFAQMAMSSSSDASSKDMMADANGMLELAVELSPAHPEISGLKAELLHMAGKSEEARKVIERCAAYYDLTTPTPAESSSTTTTTTTSEVVRASDGLSKSKLASVHLNFARAFMAIEDPEGALKQLDLSVKFRYDVPDAHQTAAAAYRMLGKNNEARAALSRANKLISAMAS
jgi:tetratricopeptide (TPR) repeat protein